MTPSRVNNTSLMSGKKKIVACLGLMAGLFSLAGCGGVPEHERECQWQGKPSWYCRHTAKADTYFTKGNTQVYFIPAYTGAKEFPVPDMPVYVDNTLDQTLRASVVLADYTAALRKTGFMETVERQGPYTIFAVPNQSMERTDFSFTGGSLMDVGNESLLKRLIGYTIVFGDYPPQKLKELISKNHGSYQLQTFYNEPLWVFLDKTGEQIIIKNRVGQENRIWVNGIPQANGTLYVTQGLLNNAP